MTRQWVRVITGKGAGRAGFIEREWLHHGVALSLVRFPGLSWPKDMAAKRAHNFELLTEAECDAMELFFK